ncbi:MAG: VWA domain-containing protein [Bacteroidota bacterium]
MLVNLYRCLLSVLLLFFYCFAYSDPPPGSQQMLSSANQLVRHLNADIQHSWTLQKKLEQFNRELLQAGDHHVVFSGNAETPEDHVLTKAMIAAEWSTLSKARLPAAFQQAFRNNLSQFVQIRDKIHLTAQRLGSEKQNQLSSIDQELAVLHELEKLYAEQIAIHRQLRKQIQKIVQTISLEENSPYALAASELAHVVREGDHLLFAILQDNPRIVTNQLAIFRRAILQAELQGPQYLECLPAQPGSKRDPGIRYEAVVKQARMFAAYAEDYLATPQVPILYKDYGTAYYYYNHLMGNKFSRTGEAVVDQYHRFLELSDVPLSRQLITPNWFKVLSPTVRTASPGQLSPQTIVFLIDVSGSMRQPNKIGLFKRSFLSCLRSMKPEDQVSLVTYSGTARLCLPPTEVRHQERILSALQQVQPGGKSSPEVGMAIAYDQLALTPSNKRGRILLISDGGFAIDKPLLDVLETGKRHQIELGILYMGQEEARMRPRLRQLATVGGGQYAYLRKENAGEILLRESKIEKNGK